jgi:Gpi18-like mannosyltransferase
LLVLLGCLLAQASLYSWITLTYPLREGLTIARTSWALVAERSLATGLLHAIVYLLLLVCASVALWLTMRRLVEPRWSVPLIVVGWFASSLVLLLAYPGESLDLFDYLFRGRMQVEDRLSPLAVAPTLYLDRLYAEYITWRGQVDTYGPIWEYASYAVAWLVGEQLRSAGYPDPTVVPNCAVPGSPCLISWYIIGYRLLAILLSGLCGGIIYRLVRHHTPSHAPAALVIWLWNPLLLLTTALGGHNDVLLLLFVLVALWLWQRERWVLGWLALALAAHVKLTALLLLPIMGLWLLVHRGWRCAFGSALVGLALAIPLSWVLYAPYGGWETLPRMLRERTLFLVNSPADLLYRTLREYAGWRSSAARNVATNGATLLFCLIAGGWLTWFFWQKKQLGTTSPPEVNTWLWHAIVVVTTLYLLIGCFWFQHWYLLWLIAPAALLPAARFTRFVLPVFCLSALLSNLTSDYLLTIEGTPLTPTQVAWIYVLLLVMPVLVAVGAAGRVWATKSRATHGYPADDWVINER